MNEFITERPNLFEHQVQSRTQEYADKWNANMFVNDFSEWDENAGVKVNLKDVYMDEYLPHFIWGIIEMYLIIWMYCY